MTIGVTTDTFTRSAHINTQNTPRSLGTSGTGMPKTAIHDGRPRSFVISAKPPLSRFDHESTARCDTVMLRYSFSVQRSYFPRCQNIAFTMSCGLNIHFVDIPSIRARPADSDLRMYSGRAMGDQKRWVVSFNTTFLLSLRTLFPGMS